MKSKQLILFLWLGLPLLSWSQTELKLLEGPLFGSKQVTKVVKQSEEEQKVTVTVYFQGITSEEPKQIKASILSGGDNPLQDINIATVDLPEGSGNVDLSFTFTPTRGYSKPYLSSRKLKVLVVKKDEKESSILDGIPGVSDGGGIDDITAPKYVFLLSKEWRVSPPTNNPDAVSSIVIPVKLLPFKSAKYIKP